MTDTGHHWTHAKETWSNRLLQLAELEIKQVILETFFQPILLDTTEETKYNTTKDLATQFIVKTDKLQCHVCMHIKQLPTSYPYISISKLQEMIKHRKF